MLKVTPPKIQETVMIQDIIITTDCEDWGGGNSLTGEFDKEDPTGEFAEIIGVVAKKQHKKLLQSIEKFINIALENHLPLKKRIKNYEKPKLKK